MYVLRKIKMFDSLTRTNVIISNRNYFFEKLKIKQKKTRAVLQHIPMLGIRRYAPCPFSVSLLFNICH